MTASASTSSTSTGPIAAVPQDQTALTIFAEIQPNQVERVRDLFPSLKDAGLDNEAVFPFAKLENVHFARLVILDPATDLEGQPLPPALVFLADFDGPLDGFLKRLNEVAGPSIDRLFGFCIGYPTGPDIHATQRTQFLNDHKIRENTVYVNWTGRTVLQVRQESQLRDKIEAFIDQSGSTFGNMTASQVRGAIQNFVRGDNDLSWARAPLPGRSIAWIVRRVIEIIGAIVLGLLLLPVILLILPVFLIVLRTRERSDIPATDVPTTARLEQLSALEDHVVHNQFSAVGLAKAGAFRRITMSTVLFVVNLGTRYLFHRGNLSGVKTIHFARWVFINDKRRLLFASNYDGSLESYMDDFIDKVAWGLNAVFSNGAGYPRTDWLVLHGAEDEQAFKNFLHNHQVPTQLWYSAYPRLTTLNVMRNAEIRAGLYGSFTDAEAANWLALL